MRKSKLLSNIILHFANKTVNTSSIEIQPYVERDINKSHFAALGLEIAIKLKSLKS